MKITNTPAQYTKTAYKPNNQPSSSLSFKGEEGITRRDFLKAMALAAVIPSGFIGCEQKEPQNLEYKSAANGSLEDRAVELYFAKDDSGIEYTKGFINGLRTELTTKTENNTEKIIEGNVGGLGIELIVPSEKDGERTINGKIASNPFEIKTCKNNDGIEISEGILGSKKISLRTTTENKIKQTTGEIGGHNVDFLLFPSKKDDFHKLMLGSIGGKSVKVIYSEKTGPALPTLLTVLPSIL